MDDRSRAWAYYVGALLITAAVVVSPLSGIADWPAILVPFFATLGAAGDLLVALSDGQPVRFELKVAVHWCAWAALCGCAYVIGHHVPRITGHGRACPGKIRPIVWGAAISRLDLPG